MSAKRLLLDGFDLKNSKDGKSASIQARVLLSRLAKREDLHCPPELWSPRGQGMPCHPNLPKEWHASISHKRGRIVVGLAEAGFGLDLEHANSRHIGKLEALINLLPEPEIRVLIQQSECRLSAYYQAWTLYESLFKLSGHTANPSESLFAVRLKSISKESLEHAVWQGGDWTLAIVSAERLQYCPNPCDLFPELKPAHFMA